MQVLRPGGLCTILAYVGHEAGKEEYVALAAALAQLDTAEWVVTEAKLVNRPLAPHLFALWRS